MELQVLSPQELLRLCLQSPDSASWDEFVRRFQPLIARVVIRTINRWTKPDPCLVDDLVHETYVKLFANSCKALREFHCDHENSLFGFLKTVASNVVHDHFRTSYNQKRGRGQAQEDIDYLTAILPSPAAGPERHVLIQQILDSLRGLAGEPTFKRDWAIFQLYFFDGLTAKAISMLPSIGLEVKGVESTLLRMVRRIRECLGRAPKGTGAGL